MIRKSYRTALHPYMLTQRRKKTQLKLINLSIETSFVYNLQPPKLMYLLPLFKEGKQHFASALREHGDRLIAVTQLITFTVKIQNKAGAPSSHLKFRKKRGFAAEAGTRGSLKTVGRHVPDLFETTQIQLYNSR